ncbi:MAG: hypothetical protein IJ017_06940 [Oscillospiraceae bacterium]|nr:hypothetical protein [Oscillospiraceae bacterium]
MTPKLALKNIIRSIARSVFIFILLASTTCLLFSNIMEYYINRRETKNAIEAFDGIGTMEGDDLSIYAEDMRYGEYIFSDPRVPMDFYPEKDTSMYRSKYSYDRLYDYMIERIESLEYVTYVDKRYMTSGVSEEYMRLDMEAPYYYDFTNCFVVEATVEQWYEYQGKLLVRDFKFIGGEKLVNFDYDKLWIAPQPVFDTGGEPYLTFRGSCIMTEKSIYTEEFCASLKPGERYIFIGRMTPAIGSSEYQTLQLTDHFAYGWCDGVWSLEGEGKNYLETEKFAPLREYIDLIETDLHTFDVVYTQNMGAIRYFADGTLAITDGRRLTREDYLNNSNVCVINHEVARVYGLEVGDTITLDLGSKLFEQYEGIGAIAAVPQRLSAEYTNVTLEIVGIWKDTRHRIFKNNNPDPCWSYNINTVFVPTHLLNADEEEMENHSFAMGEFSFVIENVYDVENFDKYEIYRLNLRLALDDGNWKEIEQHFEENKVMSLIKIAILSAAVFVAVWFTVLLYILGRKRDYAIMRLLGTTKKASRNTLLLPLSVLSASSVVIGTLTAWIYTLNNAEVDFKISQMAEYKATISIPAWLIASCIIVVLLLALGIAFLILGLIGRKSPLALMQDGSQKRTKRKKAEAVPEPEAVQLGEWVSLPRVQHDGKKRKLKFILRFVFRSIKRAKAKAIMYILVSALLLNTAGQLNIMLDSYIDTFTTTEIVSKYAGSLNLNYVSQLQESGYVRDVFYRAKRSIDINMVQTSVHVTNNISRLLGKSPNITWLDGYDESVMNTHDNIIILDKILMEKHGYNLGDTVYVTNGGQFNDKLRNSIQNYHSNNGYALSDDEVTELLYDDVVDWYMKRAGEFIIVGCIDTGPMPEFTEDSTLTEEDAKFAYLPGTTDINTAYGKLVIMEMTEATLIDNWQADEYREYGRALADANLTYEVAFIMDTAVADYLKSVILLLQLVAPIAIIAMLIIGAFMTCLIIVQTSKDIAIMRVLGTSKRRTRVIIVTERIVLYLVSTVLSVIVMLSMRGISEHTISNMTLVIILYFAAVVLSSLAASVAVTRKKVLELLQTKE